jgi:hypothetical protein
MARTLVLDTITDPDNSTGNANITLSPDSTTTLPKVDINSGAIDNTTIGAATPSSVAATTLSTTGNATVGGTLTVSGTILGADVPRIIKYVHINGSTYRVYDTANSNYHYVVHDAISYSVVSGRSYKIEAQGQVTATDDNDTGVAAISIRLHASPTNRSQGDNVTYSGGGYDGVIKSSQVTFQPNAHGSEHQTVTGNTPVHMVGLYTATATTTHYTYFSMKGNVSTNGFWFLLNGEDESGTHPTSGTDNEGVFCSFIISEIGAGVTIVNQDAN